MNIELSISELEVISHALHRLNAHNSKLLDPAYNKDYHSQHIDFFGESIIDTAKNEWEIVNKQILPKVYELKKRNEDEKN